MRRALRVLLLLACVVVAFPLAICALAYLCSPIYDFPAPRPFSGAAWYNPYASLAGSWHKVNFHGHTRTWNGLTDGKQSATEYAEAYRALGFDIAAVSNYHAIDDTNASAPNYVPTYEFGYSILETHRLCIGASEVLWLDFPLGQTRHHKQYVIDRLRPTVALLAINHPRIRHGHSLDDFRFLGNYDLIEVLNPYATSLDEWDSALSSGHAVWALGGDDIHDLRNPERVAARWTVVNAPSARPPDIFAAMRRGRHMAVRGHRGVMDNGLREVTVRNGTIEVRLDQAANRIAFVGQDGRLLSASQQVSSATYATAPADTYVRVEVETPTTTMYLNPLLRWDANALPAPRPTLNVAATWTLRAGLFVAYSVLALWAVRRRRSVTQLTRTPTPSFETGIQQ